MDHGVNKRLSSPALRVSRYCNSPAAVNSAIFKSGHRLVHRCNRKRSLPFERERNLASTLASRAMCRPSVYRKVQEGGFERPSRHRRSQVR